MTEQQRRPIDARKHGPCECGSGRMKPSGTAFCWVCETRDSVFDDLDRELRHGKYKRVAVEANG